MKKILTFTLLLGGIACSNIYSSANAITCPDENTKDFSHWLVAIPKEKITRANFYSALAETHEEVTGQVALFCKYDKNALDLLKNTILYKTSLDRRDVVKGDLWQPFIPHWWQCISPLLPEACDPKT